MCQLFPRTRGRVTGQQIILSNFTNTYEIENAEVEQNQITFNSLFFLKNKDKTWIYVFQGLNVSSIVYEITDSVICCLVAFPRV